MAEQIINRGAAPADPTAESIYSAFGKAIANFSELYTYVLSALPASITSAIGTAVLKAGSTMIGVLQFANGTALAPSAKIGADEKGLYHVATNKIGITVNSLKVGEVNEGGLIIPHNMVVFMDQKAVNTAGGASAAGNQFRDLNTEKVNTIDGATLGTNEFTLPAGTYYIKEISAPTYAAVGINKVRLYNSTDAATVTNCTGTTEVPVAAQTGRSVIRGVTFTIGSAKTFKIQHQITNLVATNGLGIAANMTDPEVYTYVEIWQVA